MQITIISLIEDLGCTSLRYLSSYIRSKGHTTKLIFLPRLYSERWGSDESYKYPYPLEILQQLKWICLNSDVIAISLMSCHFDNAVAITKYLRSLHKTIIWGGIHPTISPYECLEYADMVCVGEGENSIVELLDYMEFPTENVTSIPGILTNKNHLVTVGEKIHDLDKLGSPDYDFYHQYVLYKNSIVPLTNEILSDCLTGRYRTSFSRGCTSSCTYCCNNILKKLYNPPHDIRWRSIDNQIAELKWAKENIRGLSKIEFSDDTFLSRPLSQIIEFASKYKKEIDLPFIILSTPLSISYSKLKALSDAGLNNIGIGIQTVYEPVRKLYKRHETIEQIKNASYLINKIPTSLTVRYDFITDNPWGGEIETETNIKFSMQLPNPKIIRIFSLTFYPGTDLYNLAKSEGLIKDDLNEVYRVTQLTPKNTYTNEVFLLLSKGCPNLIINLLLNKYIRSINLVKILNFIWNKRKHKEPERQRPKRFNGKPGEVINEQR